MRNYKISRLFLPLTAMGICVSFITPRATAQQPEGPGQDGPRLGGQRGPGGPGGQRPGGPGGPGMPAGFVPGDYLSQYLGLTGAQQQKLTNLMKTMDALGKENFAPTAFGKLQLTEDEMRKIAAGSKLTDVLTADQQQTLNSNKRPARRGGPGGSGGPGNPEGPGRPGDQGGLAGAPPPPGGNYREDDAPVPMPTQPLAPGVTRVPVVFSGGHDTDPRDGGRPVILVANGLGVTSEVFREAFSHVHPAHNGAGPTEEEARQNKAALMNALGKYGITDEQINTVSNYYRYVRSRNELWTHSPAVANALVKDGVLVGFEIVRGGSGYTSPPTLTVPNLRTGALTVRLAFGKNLATNGSIASITGTQDRGDNP